MTLKGVISSVLKHSLEPEMWSEGSVLFTRKGSRITKTLKRKQSIHQKTALNTKNGQKGAAYSPEKAPNLGKRSKGSHLFTQKER